MSATCGALTRSGTPCRKHPVTGGDRCRWHGDDPPVIPRRIDPDAPKPCRSCGRTLPPRCFAVWNSCKGVRYRKPTCRTCEDAKRRAAGLPLPRRLPPRFNARGAVHCRDCDRYLPRDRFAHPPSFKGRPVPYCRACMRVRDKLRPKYRRGTPQWRADIERRSRDHRRRTAAEIAGRKAFVLGALDLLRRRGFTTADIVQLAGVSTTAIHAWERRRRRPDPNAAERLAVVLRATGTAPIGPEATRGRRRPHPALPLLLARIGPELARYPLRSRRRDRDERRVA